MANQEKKQLGTERPSKQKDKKTSMEVHQMDIQRVLSVSLSSTDNLLEGLNLCLEGCLQISGMDCGGIYLFDDKVENLKLILHSGFKDDFVDGLLSYDKTSHNVILVKRGNPIFTSVSELDVSLMDKEDREGLRAFASIPLFDNANVIGCINVASHIHSEISISSRIALETIAAQVGNVIARLQATKALQESEEHLRSLMESASNFAVFRLANEEANPHLLKVVFVSPSINDILSIDKPMIFETWFENMHPNDVERITEANRKAFETFRFDEEYQTWNKNKGEWRWIHAISTGTFDEKNWTGYVNGIMIDITERKLAENALIAKEKELELKTNKLEEINTALNVLLTKREEDKTLLQEQVLSNVKKLAVPYVEKLKKSKLNETQIALIDVIESSLHEIISPFSLKLPSESFGLTPTEIKVADLIRQGNGSKEVAVIHNLSPKTVERHRESIRNKIGIKNKKINLQSYLSSLL
jgi:PAS domain S-box-containing protein